MRKPGFTLLEIMISMVLLGILAAAVIPTTKRVVKRQKELELKQALMEVRLAIDRFKKAHEEGKIIIDREQQLGYPRDFEQLIEGVPLTGGEGKKVRFLRRIPLDPMTGEASWGLRSVQDPPDSSSWGRENLFDIYSLSNGIASDGTEYSEW